MKTYYRLIKEVSTPEGVIPAGTSSELQDNTFGADYCEFGSTVGFLVRYAWDFMDRNPDWFEKVIPVEGGDTLPVITDMSLMQPVSSNEKLERLRLMHHSFPQGDHTAWWELHTHGALCMDFIDTSWDECRVWSSTRDVGDNPQNTFRGQFKLGDARVKRFTSRLLRLEDADGTEHLSNLQYNPFLDGTWLTMDTEPIRQYT